MSAVSVVVEDVHHNAREEQVAHVVHRLTVFVFYCLVHERMAADEIQHGIYKQTGTVSSGDSRVKIKIY